MILSAKELAQYSGIPEERVQELAQLEILPVTEGDSTLESQLYEAAAKADYDRRQEYYDDHLRIHDTFFCELRDKPIKEQHELLDLFPLQTSIRIVTSKSVHAYWLRKGKCSEAEWREVQAGLSEHFNSDVNIKNPPLVMPPVSYDEEKRKIYLGLWEYSVGDMMRVLWVPLLKAQESGVPVSAPTLAALLAARISGSLAD